MELLIYTDGGSRGNPGPSAAGGVVYQDHKDGVVVHEFSKYLGMGTNNEAEYSALLESIRWAVAEATSLQATSCTWHLDSKLVVEQINKNWKIKEPRMKVFAQQCWELLEALECKNSVTYIPRAENSVADSLVNQALDAHAE